MPPSATTAFATVDDVRAAEARVSVGRTHANELIELVTTCGAPKAPPKVRLASVQACRSLFNAWADAGDLLPLNASGDMADGAAPIEIFRSWLLRIYRRFVAVLCEMLSDVRASLGLRLPVLDSLFTLARMETAHSRPGRVDPGTLNSEVSALRQLITALVRAKSPLPDELLERLQLEHLCHLDAAFYFLVHIRRLARAEEAPSLRQGDRLIALLLLITPPVHDVEPRDAKLLAAQPLLPAPRKKRARADHKGTDKSNAEGKGSELSEWSVEARQLLSRQRHRALFCKTWRAVLDLKLTSSAFRSVLRQLPEAVLPNVPVPLRYCDLLSDGYSRGGVDAIYALRGLFVLMTQHHLEYPRFYPKLYTLVSAEALNGPHREVFVKQLSVFLSSVALPAYLLAAFCKRLGRLALFASPSGAALACALAFNVMLQHPSARVLIHRSSPGMLVDQAEEDVVPDAPAEEPGSLGQVAGSSGESFEDALLIAEAMAADPFLPGEEEPEATRAIDSCLWEVEHLRQHYCPTVASLAGLFAAPILPTTTPIDLDPLACLTYSSLGQLETRKKLRAVPMAIRAPGGLFGVSPPGMPPGSQTLNAGLSAWR